MAGKKCDGYFDARGRVLMPGLTDAHLRALLEKSR
jgi:predicted amidohydrolase YtcJ